MRSLDAVEAAAAKLDGDEATGARIVAKALTAPLKQIAENAGMDGGVVVDRVRELTGTEGLNAATGVYEDLVKIGVIDAAKVTRSALQNAASIAALFLTTEAIVADKPDRRPRRPPRPRSLTDGERVTHPSSTLTHEPGLRARARCASGNRCSDSTPSSVTKVSPSV